MTEVHVINNTTNVTIEKQLKEEKKKAEKLRKEKEREKRRKERESAQVPESLALPLNYLN